MSTVAVPDPSALGDEFAAVLSNATPPESPKAVMDSTPEVVKPPKKKPGPKPGSKKKKAAEAAAAATESTEKQTPAPEAVSEAPFDSPESKAEAASSPKTEPTPAEAKENSHQEFSVPAQVQVKKQFFKSGQPEGEEQNTTSFMWVHQFVTQPALVDIRLGLTLNLGNFESAKISVGVTVPCYKEEMTEAFEFAKAWVAPRLQAEVEEVRSQSKNVGEFSL